MQKIFGTMKGIFVFCFRLQQKNEFSCNTTFDVGCLSVIYTAV